MFKQSFAYDVRYSAAGWQLTVRCALYREKDLGKLNAMSDIQCAYNMA